MMKSDVQGSGEPLVFVPGGLTGWLSWIPFAVRLSATRKTVRLQLISVQSGLDASDLPVGYSLRTETQAMGAELERLGLDSPVDIVGWSQGAVVALDYALEHPERVRSLALIEPPAFWTLGADDPEVKTIADSTAGFVGEISEAQLENFLGITGLQPPGKSAIDLPSWPTWVQHRQSLRGIPFVNRHTDSIDRLSRVKCPVLLVKGTGSAPVLHRVIDSLVERLPNAEVAEFAGGHAPHIVSAEAFMERLSEFLPAC
jgi:pimeloyl-ACP methyl ester carboxylesterase